MSETKWTDKQLLAIEEKGTDLLVSAAAGSGKTAVLTERIIRQLTDPEAPVDVTDFLIVTFTVSATSELREKLSRAIREAYMSNKSLKRLKRQILNLPSAKILTIDSFCKYIVKECSKQLGIPSDFRTGEESELNQLTNEIISETIDKFFNGFEGEKLYNTDFLPDSTRTGFLSVVETFTTQKSLEQLSETVVEMYLKLTKYPEPINRAKEYLKEYYTILKQRFEEKSDVSFFDTKIGLFIANEIRETAEVARGYFEAAEKLLYGFENMSEKYGPVIQNDIAAASRISFSENKDILTSLSDYSASSLSPYRCKNDVEKPVQEMFKKLRDEGKEILNNLKKKYPISDENMIFMQIADTFSIANELFAIVIEFHKRLTEAKFEKKIFSFDDIAQLAYTALVREGSYNKTTREFERTDYAKELGEKFHEILIDEYQDVNELQDTIFRAVSNSHNRFMVGDLKQSIYKFRGATPEIFYNYRNTFSPITSDDGSPRLVSLQNNFRSDKSVIDFVNRLFSVIMNYNDDTVYREDDYLTYTPIATRPDRNLSTEFTVIGNDAEFDYVADTILKTVNLDKTYKFSDICILARKHDSLKKIQGVLSERNIPSDYTPNDNFFGSFEIQTIHHLLKAIDNPTDDVAVLSAMTSPIFSFSPSELIEVRNCKKDKYIYFAVRDYSGDNTVLKDKCKNLVSRLKSWRKKSGTVSSDTFIWWLYNRTHFMSFVQKLNNGDDRKENLLTFYGIASKYEEREFKGLTSFLAYLESLVNSKNRLGKKDTSTDAVHLMTIHDSKGLEFPFCFYISSASQISRADERKKIVVSETFGPTFSVPMGQLGGKIATYAEKAAISETRSGVIDEELRLLYVALTRAKNKLIITGQTDIEKFKKYVELSSMSQSTFSHSIKNASSMLKVIGTGLSSHPVFAKAIEDFNGTSSASDDTFCVNLFGEYTSDMEINMPMQDDEKKSKTKISKEDIDYALIPLGDKLKSETPYKISVSSLREGLLDEGARATVITVRKYPEFKSLDSENIASFTGTAMHVFMQFCDFENCMTNGTVAEAERLQKYGFITEKQKTVLNHLSLSAFFKSETYKQIRTAQRVEREKRYTLLINSSNFYSDVEKKKQLDSRGYKTLIQGVIDCYYVNSNNEIVLVDFKTDAVSKKNGESILKERHSKQMQLYKDAIFEIEGKPVDKSIIYSFALSKEIEI